jgi:hypothetical protein
MGRFQVGGWNSRNPRGGPGKLREISEISETLWEVNQLDGDAGPSDYCGDTSATVTGCP